MDVDVLDFIDAPLAENTDSRNVGPSLRDLRVALEEVKRRGGARVMSIGELNATRSAGAPDAIANFVAALAAALAADWNHAGGLTTLRRRGIGMPTRCEGYCQ